MADPSVSERRIRPIQDAVASGNWKQALKEADKWQKKGEKSDRFLALRSYVLVNQADKTLRDRGHSETLQLCGRKPAVTDLDAIHQLLDTLRDLSLQDEEGPKLWERAVATKPADKDLLMTWLNRSVADSNWLSAQKAAMALRKAFPKERQYDFWNIVLCYLIHRDAASPEKDRTLFGMLAFRLVSKAAESVPEDQEQLLTPGKAISTPEELYLLVHIFLANNKASDAVDLLQSPTLGPNSRVGQQDPQLMLSLLLQTLEASERWDDAFTICQNLLTHLEHQKDDRIWDLLLQARRKGDFVEDEDFQQILNGHLLRGERPARSSQLAKLKYLQSRGDAVNQSDDHLFQACTQYYHENDGKGYCFEDLRKPVRSLDADRLGAVRTLLETEVLQKPSNFNRLFQLKFRYCFPGEGAKLEDEMGIVCTQALELYQGSMSQGPSCPEAALLAAMAMLRMSIITDRSETKLQATLLVETCRSRFEDYYPFSVLLVQCYRSLGLISLAMEVFTKLSIKNLQWETVGHLMLTRISTLHPHHTGSKENRLDPASALDAGLTMLENSDRALVRGVGEGLKFGSYSNIIDSVEMRTNIAQSLNKQLYAIEDRRVERILGHMDENILETRTETIIDKRDFEFLPIYSDEDLQVHESLHCGPLPKETWIDSMAQIDHVITFLKHDLASPPHPATVAKVYEALTVSARRRKESTKKSPDELTPAEAINIEFFEVITQVIFSVHGNDQDKHSDKPPTTTSTPDSSTPFKDLQFILSQILDEVESSTPPATKSDFKTNFSPSFGTSPVIANIPIPAWSYLHSSYLRLELVQAIPLFLAWTSKQAQTPSSKSKPKTNTIKPTSTAVTTTYLPSKTQVTELKTTASKIQSAIHESAQRLKDHLNKPGVLGELVDVALDASHQEAQMPTSENSDRAETKGGLGKVLQLVNDGDEAALETLCGRVRDCWEDSLRGILGVKVQKW